MRKFPTRVFAGLPVSSLHGQEGSVSCGLPHSASWPWCRSKVVSRLDFRSVTARSSGGQFVRGFTRGCGVS